jgi:putative FmdB family regulatory protein
VPIYEYECSNCSHKFERKESFNGNPQVPCPKCGSKTKRIFSVVPIIFNGPGFYCTDNGHKSSTTIGASPESKTTTESKPSSENKKTAENKPADGTKMAAPKPTKAAK